MVNQKVNPSWGKSHRVRRVRVIGVQNGSSSIIEFSSFVFNIIPLIVQNIGVEVNIIKQNVI